MKQVFLLSCFFILIFTSSFSQDITHIYDPYAVKREVGQFHQLVVSGPFRIMVKQGKEVGLAVSSENVELRDAIEVNVKDGVLRIKFGGAKKLNMKGKARAVIYVSVTEIDSMNLSGVSSLVTDGQLAVTSLGISISGASDLDGAIQAERLNIRQSGASDVKLKGNVNIMNVQLSGASDLKAFDLISNSCHAVISGASDMKINVSRHLEAKVSGASDLRYSGNPASANVKSTGASTVKQINK